MHRQTEIAYNLYVTPQLYPAKCPISKPLYGKVADLEFYITARCYGRSRRSWPLPFYVLSSSVTSIVVYL